MNLRKGITIVLDLVVAFWVGLIGVLMLPADLLILWFIFNVYMWIVAPITLLWAIQKEKEKMWRVVSNLKKCEPQKCTRAKNESASGRHGSRTPEEYAKMCGYLDPNREECSCPV